MARVIDPKKILDVADQWVRDNDRWAAFPSTDTGITAVVEAMCAELNTEIRDFVLRMLGVIANINNPEAFNYALEEIRKLIGPV